MKHRQETKERSGALDDVVKNAADLAWRLTELADEAKVEARKRLGDLNRAIDAARRRLDEYGETDADAWDDLKADVLASWDAFKEACDRALHRNADEAS